ncbi:hypothetical protein [Fluviicoccus keumensis]|uniref:hypothetical protein n=1 Tax=Fluviicoccus keumensis TaxID=1435465 RepID=UPI00102AC06C|nr:hypothetical protein [Fluviicoccus keumensis]
MRFLMFVMPGLQKKPGQYWRKLGRKELVVMGEKEGALQGVCILGNYRVLQCCFDKTCLGNWVEA